MSQHESADSFLVDSKDVDSPFYSRYEPKEVLGRGLCSVVRRCVDKNTLVSYAVKIIDLTRKDNFDASQAREAGYNEVELLKSCSDHPHIIRLHETFETEAFLFLIFELCPNGELFDLLTKRMRLSEKRTRAIMKQLLESLAFLHSKRIMHRDIKCENILLDEEMNIRVSDFGFATKYDENIHYKELLGTPGYISPEMLKANSYADQPSYGLAVDMWSCGVVFYTLISGSAPFYHRKTVYMLRDIMNGKYSFPSSEWQNISTSCKQLISRMLCVDPARRITAKEALEHEFFAIGEVDSHKTVLQKLKCVIHAIRFITRLRVLSTTNPPVYLSQLKSQPYSYKPLRQLIDESAFSIYGHWVKHSDQQGQAPMFEYHLKPHRASSHRHRMLSGQEEGH